MSNPQPDWARWEAEHGSFPSELPPVPPTERPAPVDVETARHLWWGVAALGMINLLVTLIVVYGQRSEYAQQLIDDVQFQDSSVALTLESAESYMTVALVMMVIIGAGFGLLFLYWVNKMRHGKLWARMVLTMIGTVTVVLSIPQIFGLGADGGAMTLVMGVAGILQGVLAAGAIYLMHRKESNAYFAESLRKK